MSLWGESRDADLATLYRLPHDSHLHLPPQPTQQISAPKPSSSQGETPEEAQQKEEEYENEIFPSPMPKPGVDEDDSQHWTTATTTQKKKPKPTEHLPDDHDVAEGYSRLGLDPTRPSNQPQLDAEASASPQPTTSRLGSMAALMKDSTWFFFAAGSALLLGGSLLGYFLWRRFRRSRGQGGHPYDFEPVAGEESGSLMAMTERRSPTSGASTRTRDLYDAFGVGSSDEDEEDDHKSSPKSPQKEQTGPRRSDSAEVLFSSEETR